MTIFYGLSQIDAPVLADQQRHTFITSDGTWHASQGAIDARMDVERESDNSTLSAGLHDDDDLYICVCMKEIIYIYISSSSSSYRAGSTDIPDLSRHSSLSFIALGKSSGQQPVSSHSCWMYVRAGRPAFARPCVGIHKSTSLMSSSLLLQQCPACLVRLTWIVFVIGGRWPYSWCLVGCCCQDLFRIARSILV